MTIDELKARIEADNRDNPAAPEASESAFELWQARNEIMALVEACERCVPSEYGVAVITGKGGLYEALDAFNAKLEAM